MRGCERGIVVVGGVREGDDKSEGVIFGKEREGKVNESQNTRRKLFGG